MRGNEMSLIYLVLAIAGAYLITITPETYIQLGYVGVVAYSSFQLGMLVQAVALQSQVNEIYQNMQAEFNAKLRAAFRETDDD
jgi:hypothetical protein